MKLVDNVDLFFFFSSRRRHTRFDCDWSSDVCSSDLAVVTYSNESKTRLLGVDKKLIKEFGAVSQQVARDMARGVRHIAKTDFGLAVTGIAGPGGGTEEKPVGLIYIALADDAHTEHRKLMIPGDRELVRWRASQAALDMLRRRLL